MRLDPGLRFASYATFAALFVTGVVWLAADQLKDSAHGETWQAITANMLMIHGTTAMIALVLLGAMIPLHIRGSWRIGKNRITGAAMVGTNAVLVATASGLYYAGTDFLRTIVADAHIAVGIALPALIVAHIARGRRAGIRHLAGDACSRPVDFANIMRTVTLSSEDPVSR